MTKLERFKQRVDEQEYRKREILKMFIRLLTTAEANGISQE